MGRTLSINSVDTQTFQVLAGEQINENDLVQMGDDGKGYRVRGTNTAAVSNRTYGTEQTNAATGMIVAQTQVVATNTTAYYRQALLRGDDGSIYTLTAQNNSKSSGGLMLSKYSVSGSLLAKVDINTSTDRSSSHQMFVLNNGSICVFANIGDTKTMSFAIYDTNLMAIKSLTTIATATSDYSAACALSGGGFAVVFQPSATPLLSKLVAYDNLGDAVLPATTIWTRTGTSGIQYHRMAQLSDGNLVVTASSANTVSSIGLFHGIVTASGGSVLPFENLDSSVQSSIPELSVMDGYYAVCAYCSTQQKAFVFTNSGTLQGSPFSATGGGGSLQIKLLNDGSNFFMIWPRQSDSKEVLTKIPVTGTGYITTDVVMPWGASESPYNSYIDAFCERGTIIVVSLKQTSTMLPMLWTVDLSTSSLKNVTPSYFGISPGTSIGSRPRVIPGGDFSFICLYDYTNTASTNLYIGKYANTAIMGVAKTSGAAGQLVAVTGESGGHAINKLDGPASVAFDHSAATIIGNKGTLMNYGVTLKGI